MSTYGVRGEALTTGGTAADYFGLGNTNRLSTGTRSFTAGALGLNSSSSGSSSQTYTRTSDGLTVGYKAQNRWYYVQDHLGSVVGIFSATGTYSGGYAYSPYGEARATGTTAAVTTNPLRYIAGYHDGNGIYKLGARYYDASLGRFTQVDPSGQEQNPYAYAAGNPISMADPSGLISEFLAYAIGDLVQAAFDVAGILIAAVIGAAHPIAAGILGVIYGATGGAIGAGITSTLLGMNPDEVQAEALYGALYGVLGHFVEP